MSRTTSKNRITPQRIVWVALGIFAISGILPWFTVDFPIGNLKISVLDIATYFADPQKVPVDFYSSAIYGILLAGWIFALGFLIITAAFQRAKLLFVSTLLITISAVIWSIIVPHLRIQMIFLSLSNQAISTEQAMGSGQVASIIAGLVMAYSYIKLKLQ
jgi:hypothetical protein